MSEQQAQGADAAVDLNNELKTRREKLALLREQGVPFPNDFRRDHTSDLLHADFDAKENEELEALNIEVAVAGRMMTRRIMGKASFVTLQDVGAVFSYTLPVTICRKVFTTSSSKNGTWAISWARKASCSKPRPASCPFTVLSCVC
jgi:lysyl-tRNA synthetase class II